MKVNEVGNDVRPLVVRMGALGDMIMLLPFLQRIYERTGMTVDLVVCGNWNRVLFTHCAWVNKIYIVDSRNAPYWFNRSKQRLVAELKSSAANRPWYLLEHLPALYRLMDRAKLQRSYALFTDNFKRINGEHTCEQFLRIADAAVSYLPAKPDSAPNLIPHLKVTPDQINECNEWLARKQIDSRIHKIILIQAGNKKTTRMGKVNRKSNIKFWPEAKWAELIQRIALQNPDAKILLCGVPQEIKLCNAILDKCGEHARSQCELVADDLPLSRLMALATLAHSCISVDTGPAHIAAAVGCPLVVLFGKSDPRQFRPLSVNEVNVVANLNWQDFHGSPQEWAAQNDMEHITVDMVFEGWRKLSGHRAGFSS